MSGVGRERRGHASCRVQAAGSGICALAAMPRVFCRATVCCWRWLTWLTLDIAETSSLLVLAKDMAGHGLQRDIKRNTKSQTVGGRLI